MTSNQLGYMANQENARHNVVVETETQRHNEAMEKLNDDANRINQDKNVLQANYQAQMADIQREYNRAYIKLQQSQGDERNRISAKLADIEQEKTWLTGEYQRNMSEVAMLEADIKRQATNETKRHNVNLESLERERLENGSWAEQKLAEFNLQRLGAETGYWSGLLANQQVATMNAFTLGSMQNQLRQQENDIRYTATAGDILYKAATAKLNKTQLWLNFTANLADNLVKTGNRLGSKLVVGD